MNTLRRRKILSETACRLTFSLSKESVLTPQWKQATDGITLLSTKFVHYFRLIFIAVINIEITAIFCKFNFEIHEIWANKLRLAQF